MLAYIYMPHNIILSWSLISSVGGLWGESIGVILTFSVNILQYLIINLYFEDGYFICLLLRNC